MRATRFIPVVLASLLVPAIAGAVLDPAIKCQAAKLKLAGKYASCRLIADANAVKNGTAADYTACDTKLETAWYKVEASIGECLTEGDLEEVYNSIVECVPSTDYTMRIFATSSQTLSGIQLNIDYSQAAGEFPGADASVECTNLVPGTLFARDDNETPRELVLANIWTEEYFSGTIELARCVFDSGGIAAPSPSSFSVAVQAVDPGGNPVMTGVSTELVFEPIY